MWSRLVKLFGLALGIFVLSCPIVKAQTTFGSIAGTVTDTSKAVIPQAKVTLTNLGTAETRTQMTSAQGFFRFVNLNPGQYEVAIQKHGFKNFDQKPISLEVGQTATINATLAVGAVTQTVEVTAATPLLQSQTSSLGQVIGGRLTTQLPLNGRNPMNLVSLVPSVVPQGQFEGSPVGKNPFGYANFQIGGAITGQGAEYLDGVPLNNSYINELSLIPTQDAIAEFKVQTNNLSAEWGRFAGGVINFTTKSGTNKFHGTAYEFLRNKVLDANTFFLNAAGQPRGPFVQNQFGGNIGGPVYIPHIYNGRNKTFFFFSYEGFRQRIGQTFVESVPTAAEKQGDFSNYRDANGNLIPIYDPTTTTALAGGGFTRQQISCNGALNVICPGIVSGNPAVQFMLGEFPNPTGAGQQYTHINNYTASSSGGGNTGEEIARVDQNISNKQRLFVRFVHWSNLNFPIDPFKTGVCQDRCTETFGTNNIVVDDVYNLSSNTVMDVRLSYGRLKYDRVPADVGLDLSKLGPDWAPLNNQVVLSDLPIPCFNGGPDSYLGNVFCTQGAGSVIIARDDTPRIAGSLSWVKGRHTFKFGGEFRIDHHNYLQTNTPVGMFNFNSNFTQFDPTTATVNGIPTGSGFASFLLGYGASVSQGYVNPVASQQLYPALYAEDTYRVTSKLTLNLGMRWEQNGPYSERFNRISYLQPDVATRLPQLPCSTLPAATAAAYGASQICLSNLKGDLGIVASSSRPQRYGQNKSNTQFSPRLGFAYQLTPNTVVRGGYGLFWISNAVEFSEAPNTDGVNGYGTPWVTSVDGGNTPCVTPSPTGCVGGATFNLRNPFPNGIQQPPGRNIALYDSLSYGGGPAALFPQNPYAYYQQWNLDVQRQLPGNTLIDLAYAGSKGTHLPDYSQQLNPLPDKYLALGSHLRDLVPNPFQGLLGPQNTRSMNTASTIQLQQLLLPYPQYGGYAIAASGWGSSIYHSMQLKVQKRMKSGGVVLVSYTISKMITTGDVDSLISWLESTGSAGIQDWNNRGNSRSLSSYDVPQRLVVSYAVDLPVGKGKRFLPGAKGVGGALISGWGVDGFTTWQRGFPLNFSTTGGTTATNFGMRPNKTGTGQLSGSVESRLNRYFNTSVFSVPANFTLGNESRTDPVLRAPGIFNTDFSIYKNTPLGIGEATNLQFRTEFFNLFNKPQFGPPNTTVGSGNLGIISSQLNNPRLIEFSLRLSF